MIRRDYEVNCGKRVSALCMQWVTLGVAIRNRTDEAGSCSADLSWRKPSRYGTVDSGRFARTSTWLTTSTNTFRVTVDKIWLEHHTRGFGVSNWGMSWQMFELGPTSDLFSRLLRSQYALSQFGDDDFDYYPKEIRINRL